MTSAVAIPFRVLYLFAGVARQADFGDALRSVVELWNSDASARPIELQLIEVDTLRGGLDHNLLDEGKRTEFLSRISAGEFDVVMVAPPCNTYTRAVFREGPGPKPIRDKTWPRGFPWLEGDARVRAEEGNVLVDFAISALAAAASATHSEEWRCTRGWLEFPEDLGAAHLGQPASIWQRSDLREIPGLTRHAIFQCEWAPVDYSKPTGLLTDIVNFFDGKSSYPGWPDIDSKGNYRGPLPQRCPHAGHVPLKGRDDNGNWRTAPTGAYHGDICLHIAVKAFADFCGRISTRVEASAPADGGSISAGLPVFQLCGPVQHLSSWLNGGGTIPRENSRNYVSGSSIALGLRFQGEGVQVFTGHPMDQSILPTINTVIADTLAANGKHLIWTSVQLNMNTVAEWHADKGNIGPSAIGAIGEYDGGEFHLTGYPMTSIRDKLLIFDGTVRHRSYPFQGRRFSFVAFRHPGLHMCSKADRGRLKALGFVLEDPRCLLPPVRVALDTSRLWDPSFLYIGRGFASEGVERSVWANPYIIGKDGTREEVIEKFRQHLLDSSELLAMIPQLEGRKIMCHCGLDQQCHGDVLIEAFTHHAQMTLVLHTSANELSQRHSAP